MSDPGRIRTCNLWFVRRPPLLTQWQAAEGSTALSIRPQGQAHELLIKWRPWQDSNLQSLVRHRPPPRGREASKNPTPYPFGHRVMKRNCVVKRSDVAVLQNVATLAGFEPACTGRLDAFLHPRVPTPYPFSHRVMKNTSDAWQLRARSS